MTEPEITPAPAPAPAPAVLPIELPPLPQLDGTQLAAISAAMQRQMQLQYEALQRQAQQSAEANFERWRAEQEARTAILSFAQHATTPTLERPHALPFTAEQIVTVLSTLPADGRRQVQQLLTDILASGLAAFDAVGRAGDGREARDVAGEWQSAITAKVALGLSRSAAIEAVRREQPALFAEYNAAGRVNGRA